MLNDRRPTRAEISTGNLSFNFKSAKSFIGEDLKYMAVVKADAYGHGAVRCAEILDEAGADRFGVALIEEGIELRKGGIAKPILCFGSFWHGQEKLLFDYDLTPVIFSLEKAELLNQYAKQTNKTADIHLKIDTGMNRVGVRFDEAEKFADNLKKFENLNLEGIMTHFAIADDLSQTEFTQMQIKRFEECRKIFESKGFCPLYADMANSPGAVIHEKSRGNMVRLGGILYGLGDDVLPKDIAKPELKPVLSFYSEIALLKTVPKGETIGYSRTFQTRRETLLATVPVGYHDGFRRNLSDKAKVIVNGSFAPVVGRVSMDWILVDVTDVKNVKTGDRAVLIGEENGLRITAADWAEMLGTISYEITCGIGSRVPRIYTN